MKASRYIVLSFLVSLVSFSLAAQVNDTYVVPAAGNAPGANGTTWATQLSLFNPILNKVPFGIPPLAHFQQSLPVAVDRGSVEFFLDDPSAAAVVFPYVSVVDPGSGDPTYHSPVLLATPAALFSASVAKKAVLLSSPGRKIDTRDARAVREAAIRLGEAPFRER